MTSSAPMTIQISLPEEQLTLLENLKQQNEKLLKMLNQNAWLNEDEAAERLGVSKATVQRWRKEGWLRHCRDGEKIIIYKKDHLDHDIEKKLGVSKYRE